MPLPKVVDFRIVTGDVYEHVAEYTDGTDPIDITGEDVTMDFYSDDTTVFTLTDTDGLSVDGTLGLISIELTSDQTTLLDDGGRKKRYVLRLDTSETTIMVGKIEMYNFVPES